MKKETTAVKSINFVLAAVEEEIYVRFYSSAI